MLLESTLQISPISRMERNDTCCPSLEDWRSSSCPCTQCTSCSSCTRTHSESPHAQRGTASDLVHCTACSSSLVPDDPTCTSSPPNPTRTTQKSSPSRTGYPRFKVGRRIAARAAKKRGTTPCRPSPPGIPLQVRWHRQR